MTLTEDFEVFIVEELRRYLKLPKKHPFFISTVMKVHFESVTIEGGRKARILNNGNFLEGDKVLILRTEDDELFVYSPFRTFSLTKRKELDKLKEVFFWINIYFDMGCIIDNENNPAAVDLLSLAREEAEKLRDDLQATLDNLEGVVSGGFYDKEPSFWTRLHPPLLTEQWLESYKEESSNPIIYPEYHCQDVSDARADIDVIENRYYPIGSNINQDCYDELAELFNWSFQIQRQETAGHVIFTFKLFDPPPIGNMGVGVVDVLLVDHYGHLIDNIAYEGAFDFTIFRMTASGGFILRLTGYAPLRNYLLDIEQHLSVSFLREECADFDYNYYLRQNLFYPAVIHLRLNLIEFYCTKNNQWLLTSYGSFSSPILPIHVLWYFSRYSGWFSYAGYVYPSDPCDYYYTSQTFYLGYKSPGTENIYHAPDKIYLCLFHPNKGDTLNNTLADTGKIVDIHGSRALILEVTGAPNAFIKGHATSRLDAGEPNEETGEFADCKVGCISIHYVCGEPVVNILARPLDTEAGDPQYWNVSMYANREVERQGGDYQTYYDAYKSAHPPLPLSGDILDLTTKAISPESSYTVPVGEPELNLPVDPPALACHIIRVGDVPSNSLLTLTNIDESVAGFRDTLADEAELLLNHTDRLDVTKIDSMPTVFWSNFNAFYNLIHVIFVSTSLNYNELYSSFENSFRKYKHILFILLDGGSVSFSGSDITMISADMNKTQEERLLDYKAAIKKIIADWEQLENKS